MNKLKAALLKKSNLWHVGAIVLFAIIACAYFAPALKGYSVKQPDIVNFVGMSREVVDFRDNNGEQILWTNAMFSGMPAQQISMAYEGTWLSKTLMNIASLGLPRPISFMFLYFIGFYILALSLRIKPFIGILGSVAFGLSSYFIVIIEAGHNSKALAIGLAPLMIAGFIMAYRFKNWILGVALSSLFMMMELYVNHVQITYYMAFILLLMGLAEFVRYLKEEQLLKFFKITGFLVVGYGLAILANYGNLFGTVEYAKQTIRGGTELTINPDNTSNESIKTAGLDRDYITNWSYGHGETFTFFVPNFKGGASQYIGSNDANDDLLKDVDRQFRQGVAQSNQYWGDQPGTSGPVYIGIIVMFLAFLGMVYVKDNFKWALLSVALLTVMLSWGKNFVSAAVIIPILLYNVNFFLKGRKQLVFTGIVTFFLLILMAIPDLIVNTSLTDFFLDYVPGYNKLRAVTIILVVAELCAPLLGILFLQRLIKHREEIQKNIQGFYIVAGAFLLFLLIMLMSPTFFNTFLSGQETDFIASIQDSATQAQYMEMFDAVEEARISIFTSDVLRSLGFFVLAAGLIFAFIRAGFSKVALAGGLTVLILLDLVLVDKRYLNNDGKGKNYDHWIVNNEYQYPYTAGEGEKQILAFEVQQNPVIGEKVDSALQVLNKEMKEEDDVSNREKQARRDLLTYRVLNRNTNFRVLEDGNPFNSSYTSYFNKSLGGYHGAKLSRYNDLITFHIARRNPAVVNMLNARYTLSPQRDQQGRIINSQLTGVNPQAMGNAWFAKEIKVVESADEEIMAMEAYNATTLKRKGDVKVFVDSAEVNTAVLKGTEKIAIQLPGMQAPFPVDNIPYQALSDQALALIVDSTGMRWILDSAPDTIFDKVFSLESGGYAGWDPEQTTIIDNDFTKNLSASSYSGNGSIEMTNYHPDRMTYKSISSDKQLAVFSEIYYEGGWKAYIDNKEVPVSRVNYVLRAVEVPAGEHEIRFEFTVEAFEKSGMYANIGSIAILLLVLFGLFLQVKNADEETVDEVETLEGLSTE